MVRFLEREGFQLIRVRGSHHYLARGSQRTSVPVPANRTLKTGTLRNILRSIDLTPEDFAQRFNAS
ncbi:MAG: type II toxin-antitoxin system HicA family toxin [Planctomycetia bacterium]|nr:type II toxin-antitoxin system HicA family toxin [Planctomycetia bacterium]